MENVNITLVFDEEKLGALEFCLKKEKTTVQARLDDALAQLYEQTVPQPLREYLDSRAAPAPPSRPKRPPRPAPPKTPQTAGSNDSVKENLNHGQ